MAENENNAAQQGAAQQFALQRIYVKDLSFESPQAPNIFKAAWKPQVNLELNTRNTNLENDLYEVVVTLTLTVKQDEQTAFLIEVQQAGVFLIKGLEPQAIRHALGAACPNILFPYARETIDTLCSKGSFPPLMLAPVNFEALFQQALQQQAQKAETENVQ